MLNEACIYISCDSFKECSLRLDRSYLPNRPPNRELFPDPTCPTIATRSPRKRVGNKNVRDSTEREE